MCLVPTKTRRFLWWIFPKVQRAKKDITVYKVLTSDCFAPYQPRYTYHLGYNYPEGIDIESKKIKENPKCYITTGWLHACSDRMDAYDIFCDLKSYSPLNYKIYEMIIPKGTKYILGNHGHICAKCLSFNINNFSI